MSEAHADPLTQYIESHPIEGANALKHLNMLVRPSIAKVEQYLKASEHAPSQLRNIRLNIQHVLEDAIGSINPDDCVIAVGGYSSDISSAVLEVISKKTEDPALKKILEGREVLPPEENAALRVSFFPPRLPESLQQKWAGKKMIIFVDDHINTEEKVRASLKNLKRTFPQASILCISLTNNPDNQLGSGFQKVEGGRVYIASNDRQTYEGMCALATLVSERRYLQEKGKLRKKDTTDLGVSEGLLHPDHVRLLQRSDGYLARMKEFFE